MCKCEDEVIEENTADADLGGSNRGKQTGKTMKRTILQIYKCLLTTYICINVFKYMFNLNNNK